MYGLIVAGSDGQANFLALNQGDNWLHLFSALAGLAIALWPARDRHEPTRRPPVVAAALAEDRGRWGFATGSPIRAVAGRASSRSAPPSWGALSGSVGSVVGSCGDAQAT